MIYLKAQEWSFRYNRGNDKANSDLCETELEWTDPNLIGNVGLPSTGNHT